MTRNSFDDNFMETGLFAESGPLLKRDTVFALIEDMLFAVIEHFYERIDVPILQSRYPFLLQYPDDALKPVNVGVVAGGVHINIADYENTARLKNPAYLLYAGSIFP